MIPTHQGELRGWSTCHGRLRALFVLLWKERAEGGPNCGLQVPNGMGHRPFPKVHGKLQLYTRKKKSLHCEGGQTLKQEPTDAVGSLEILKTALDVVLSNLIQQDLVW